MFTGATSATETVGAAGAGAGVPDPRSFACINAFNRLFRSGSGKKNKMNG